MASPMLRLRGKVSPSLMLPAYQMYNLSEEKVVNIKHVEEEDEAAVVAGSSHGWVGLFKKEGSVSLWNPMSGSRIKLPPSNDIPIDPYHSRYVSVTNLIVDDEDCRLAIWPCAYSLALCCPGRCTEWTLFGNHKWYYELLYSRHHKLLFCLEEGSTMKQTELEGWDVTDPRSPRLEWSSSLWDLGWDDPVADQLKQWLNHLVMHLVSSPVDGDGSLFLVSRHLVKVKKDMDGTDTHGRIYPYKTIAFEVRRIRTQTREMSHMKGSLDGLIMFVGYNQSFAVSAADYPHLKPDSIYFTDHVYHDKFHDMYGGHDVGIYDYKRRTVSGCYYPTLPESPSPKRRNQPQPPPFWFTPTSKSK